VSEANVRGKDFWFATIHPCYGNQVPNQMGI
jgi:hypothetical protein